MTCDGLDLWDHIGLHAFRERTRSPRHAHVRASAAPRYHVSLSRALRVLAPTVTTNETHVRTNTHDFLLKPARLRRREPPGTPRAVRGHCWPLSARVWTRTARSGEQTEDTTRGQRPVAESTTRGEDDLLSRRVRSGDERARTCRSHAARAPLAPERVHERVFSLVAVAAVNAAPRGS